MRTKTLSFQRALLGLALVTTFGCGGAVSGSGPESTSGGESNSAAAAGAGPSDAAAGGSTQLPGAPTTPVTDASSPPAPMAVTADIDLVETWSDRIGGLSTQLPGDACDLDAVRYRLVLPTQLFQRRTCAGKPGQRAWRNADRLLTSAERTQIAALLADIRYTENPPCESDETVVHSMTTTDEKRNVLLYVHKNLTCGSSPRRRAPAVRALSEAMEALPATAP